eukprot:TRINITY_DN41461_c0_g1_i1.p1 TRINITY_DN41461_c0_g1~~TRINITY_DN41461_c0_g1_i1.p1  ORF type:complete len:119 (+),score=13.79 TRINITY_DN41461_c0_g1_i1:56-412(+)
MLYVDVFVSFVFFFKQKTAYEMLRSLVGSEMCIRDRSKGDRPGQIQHHLNNQMMKLNRKLLNWGTKPRVMSNHVTLVNRPLSRAVQGRRRPVAVHAHHHHRLLESLPRKQNLQILQRG